MLHSFNEIVEDWQSLSNGRGRPLNQASIMAVPVRQPRTSRLLRASPSHVRRGRGRPICRHAAVQPQPSRPPAILTRSVVIVVVVEVWERSAFGRQVITSDHNECARALGRARARARAPYVRDCMLKPSIALGERGEEIPRSLEFLSRARTTKVKSAQPHGMQIHSQSRRYLSLYQSEGYEAYHIWKGI